MSAAPQRVPSYKRAQAKPAGPKLVRRIRPLHWRKTREQVASPIRKSSWAPTAVLPTRFLADFFRVCGGALGGVMACIAHHTFAQPHDPRAKAWTAPEWAEPMTDSDIGQEIGFTRDMIEDALEEALDRKLLDRRSDIEPEAGNDAYFQYRWTNTESWKKFATRFATRVKPKPPGTAKESTGEEVAKGGTTIPSGSTVKVAQVPPRDEAVEVKVLNNLGLAGIDVNHTLRGNVCTLKLSVTPGSLGELKAGETPAVATSVAAAGAGLASPGLYEAVSGWKELAAAFENVPVPKPGTQAVQPISLLLSERFASSLLKQLDTGVPCEFVRVCAIERFTRALRNNEPVISSMAKWVIENANETWPRHKAAWEEQRAYEANQRQLWDDRLADDKAPAAPTIEELRDDLRTAKHNRSPKAVIDAIEASIAAAEKLQRTGE